MNVKTVIAGLGLLVFIFCSVQSGQAAEDERYYYHFLDPPCEHPWQDSGTPRSNDIIQEKMVSYIFMVIGPVKMILVKPSPLVGSLSGKTKVMEKSSDGRTPK